MFDGLLNLIGFGNNQPEPAQDAQRFAQYPQAGEPIRTPQSAEEEAIELYNSLMMLTGVQSSYPHGLVIHGGEADITFHTETG